MPYADAAQNKACKRRAYDAQKAQYLLRSRRWDAKNKLAIRAWLREYLSSHPCVDCGESDIVVLEFDHRERGAKKFAIGEAQNLRVSVFTVQAEVAKCDVRCANCHRRKTYRESGHSHRG